MTLAIRASKRSLGPLLRILTTALLWQVACEFLSASRKLEPLGCTPAQAWEDIQDLHAVWKTILPSWNTLAHAQSLCQRHSISHWDALLLSACREAGIARLYSEGLDTHDGLDGLEIVNPFRPRSSNRGQTLAEREMQR
jgi:predicted nucleic acid-binding protein